MINCYFLQFDGIVLVTTDFNGFSCTGCHTPQFSACSTRTWVCEKPTGVNQAFASRTQGRNFHWASISLPLWLSEMTQVLLSGPGLTASLGTPARLLVPLAHSSRLMEQISVRFPHLLTVLKCQRERERQSTPTLTLTSPKVPWQDSLTQGCLPSRVPESTNPLSGEKAARKRGCCGSIGRLDVNESIPWNLSCFYFQALLWSH